MRNFHDTFETRKRPFINAFSICMTAPLKRELKPENLLLGEAQGLKTEIILFYKNRDPRLGTLDSRLTFIAGSRLKSNKRQYKERFSSFSPTMKNVIVQKCGVCAFLNYKDKQ